MRRLLEKLVDSSQSLTFRIAALLALALLPIGVIAVALTLQLFQQADRRAETNLLALTAEAAAPEIGIVRSGIGAAQMFAALVADLRAASLDCQAPLKDFLRRSAPLTFAGYIDASGAVVCATDGQGANVSDHPVVQSMSDDPKPRVTLSRSLVGNAVVEIVITVPVVRNGMADGFVAVTLPHGSTGADRGGDSPGTGPPLDVVTFNADAEILTSTLGLAAVGDRLPDSVSLEDLTRRDRFAFIDRTRDGRLHAYAVVPIVPGQVFALGSWPHRRDNLLAGLSASGLTLFPVAMWLICLLVAFYAVQRMVIRPTRNLRARMLQFMRSRRLSEPQTDPVVPRELREMESTWMRLAENVLQDEAKLYDTIHQRTVLLKEVHHRVKNNLQLIVSILNMKVRKARNPEIRAAMSDIRQRVMGIARVHQNLYETSTTELVQAAELLPLITQQIIRSGIDDPDAIRVEESFDEMIIYPDQAVPLSLAVTELLTNALKYLGAAPGKAPRLTVTLRREEGHMASLTVCNSLSEELSVAEPDAGTSGLGLPLIKAFAHQLEGSSEAELKDDLYCATLRFPIADFDSTDVPQDMPVVA